MLTDLKCRSAKPREKAYKLADGEGLYLFVTPTGFRSWRLKYRVGKIEKRLVIGPYPAVTLIEAREARDRARKLLRAGIDPAVDRQQKAAIAATAASNTFEAVAREWHRVHESNWTKRYAKQILDRLKADVFPEIGKLPIDAVTPPIMLQLLRKVESRGTFVMAHRVRAHCSAVFVFAIATGVGEQDPANVIRGALVPSPKRLLPAVIKIASARKLLAAVESQPGAYGVTRLASRLLALTVARPGVLRLAAPKEFEGLDGPNPLWRIPAAKMKLTSERKADASFEFVIPLATQAVDVVKVAMAMVGNGPLLFPSVRSLARPITDSTLSKLYRTAGFSGVHVPHGWRATFSTIMNELAATAGREGDRAIIDLMLAHLPANDVEAAYNRASYMPRRRALAGEWADMLMVGAAPAVTLLHRPPPD